MRFAALIALAVVLLSGTGEARAGVKVDASVKVARATWGTPTCGEPQVVWSTPALYGIGPDLGPAAWADVARCRIVLNQSDRYHTAVKLCHVIVHEWGHLAGYNDPSNTADPLHSRNPRSVMNADMRVDESHAIGSRVWEASGAFRPCYKGAGWIDLRRGHHKVPGRVVKPR